MCSRTRIHLAVGLLSTLLFASCNRSPEDTVRAFFTAVEKGDITKAKTLVSAQDIGNVGVDRFTGQLSMLSENTRKCGGIKSLDVVLEGEGEIRGGSFIVVFNGACPKATDWIECAKEDGMWKMGFDQNLRSKQRRVMADMRSLATACEGYAVDRNRYPGGDDLRAIAGVLSPEYIREIPYVDAWDTPFSFSANAEGTSYRLVSAGTDKKFEVGITSAGAPVVKGGTRLPSADIVYENGEFLRYPEGSIK